MSKTIWKYPFEVSDTISIQMPVRAQVLSVQMQFGVPCIWALVDTNAEFEERAFFLFGTGHSIKENLKNFIGTFQMSSGALVFHLFESA